MRRRPEGIYRETFTAQERRALEQTAEEVPLEAEAELLRVLIMRELRKERPDDERVGRMVDRIVRVVRAQRSGGRAEAEAEAWVNNMSTWLAEVAQELRARAVVSEHDRLAELPEAGR
ncbi:MAG TPA: hypothetical protein VG370_31295 [Chloroflexota bacterium]|nr:hypothetical protein [Chloroflexota bacterium]